VDRVFLALASLSGFLAVAVGAFGAHWLRGRLTPEMMHVFETGQRQHILHVAGLVAVAWAAARWPGGATTASGWLFVAGTVLFSGSLYLLALTGHRWLGAITPFGGLAFLLGWLVLAWRAWTATAP
jgi:uncharacterized membrane protein YgdD (TMEM256/DUF423 family)